jgi:uncharacterized protein (DUF1778 family)
MMKSQMSDTHIHLRAKASERELIDRAAAVTGVNRTQFIMTAAGEKARNIIEANSTLFLSDQQYDEFISMLDNPPEPNAALRRLLAGKAPWDKNGKAVA